MVNVSLPLSMETSGVAAKSRNATIAVLSVFAVGLCLRLFLLSNQSLWYDEGSSLYYSGGATLGSAAARLLQTQSSERYQPLFFLVLHAWRQIFGDGEFTLRLLSALCGAATIGFLYLTARAVYGTRHALMSAALLATSACAVSYSQEVRPYALLLLLAAMQLWMLVVGTQAADGARARLMQRTFWATTLVVMFGGLLVVLFAAALSLAQLLAYRDVRRWLRWWVPAALLSMPAVAYLAWSVVGPASATNEGVNPLQQPIWQNILFAPYGLLVGTTYGPPIEQLRGADKLQTILAWWPHLLVFLVIAAALLALLTVAVRSLRADDARRRPTVFLLALTILSFTFDVVLALATGFNWQPRHAVYLLLPLCLLIPLVVTLRHEVPSAWRGVFRWSAPLVGMLVLLNVVSLGNYYFRAAYQRDDYRAAAALLNREQDQGAPAIVLWGKPELLDYYGARGTIIDGTRFSKNGLAATVEAASHGGAAVLLVINRQLYWDDQPEATLERAMRPGYAPESRLSVPGFSIYRFHRVASANAAGSGSG